MPGSVTDSATRTQLLHSWCQQQRLQPAYLESATLWFDPLAARIASRCAESALLKVAVNGSQGSGKSTLCDYLALILELDHGLTSATLSLDDVYLTRAERRQLAQDIHPLLATRGVPGTHDLTLAQSTLLQLEQAHTQQKPLATGQSVALPRFDKGCDDRYPQDTWPTLTEPVDLVLMEGWCMGTPAQPEASLATPVNALEAEEDNAGRWRDYVNRMLLQHYEPFYADFDYWVMLQAPSFEQVYQWRLEQEQKLAASNGGDHIMSPAQVERFIQHYQRLTQHSLEVLPKRMDSLFKLDPQRQIISVDHL